MADRYFVEQAIDGGEARLSGSEAHHLLHVMRAKVGDEVVVFDGRGAEFVARVVRTGRTEVDLAIAERREIDREPVVAMTLGVALPKGDRRRWLVEKTVELGVARLVPFETQRSSDRESAAAGARLAQAVIEASKQCGRNRLMEISLPQTFADYVGSFTSDVPRLLAHLGAASLASALRELTGKDSAPRAIALAIGPEGGFTDEEVALATAGGWQAVCLGPRVLRVETAAIALASAVMLEFNDREPEET